MSDREVLARLIEPAGFKISDERRIRFPSVWHAEAAADRILTAGWRRASEPQAAATDAEAQEIARPVRGCATDEQWRALIVGIAAGLDRARHEGDRAAIERAAKFVDGQMLVGGTKTKRRLQVIAAGIRTLAIGGGSHG